jgi:hypothetical protein
MRISLESVGIGLKRVEAIAVLNELLGSCLGLDGCRLELTSFSAPTAGYQIIIKGVLDGETKQHIKTTLAKHKLCCQTGSLWKTKRSPNKTEPDTLIIYKPKSGT